MSVVVGIDVGTQSVKLVVYDPVARNRVARCSRPLAMASGDDGTREQLAGDWIDAIRDCFAELEPALRADVVAMGVSGQQHGFVAMDAGGHVLAPVKLWCDTSSQRECAEITAAAGGEQACIALAGNPVLVGYTASKLPWTRRHRPDAYAALAGIALPHDYVNFWLTGQRWMECGDASGTGWLDVRTRHWSPQLLAATDPQRDLAACLPPLVAPDASFPIAPGIADALGVPRTVRVSAGGGDNMMAAIGTGNVEPGVLSMSLGTSGTLFTHTDRPLVDAAARWAAFCSSDGGWLPLICTMNCTSATEAVARAFGFAAAHGDDVLAGTSPGADGLLMLPFLAGERTPNLPNVRGSLHGIDADNLTRANVYRAAMEGATYALRHGFDALTRAGLTFDSIRITGGGAHSDGWRQIVADLFDLPVSVPAEPEGAAFGAALQAWWALDHAAGGRLRLAELACEHVRMDARLAASPRQSDAARYRHCYARFLHHLDAVRAEDASLPSHLPPCPSTGASPLHSSTRFDIP